MFFRHISLLQEKMTIVGSGTTVQVIIDAFLRLDQGLDRDSKPEQLRKAMRLFSGMGPDMEYFFRIVERLTPIAKLVYMTERVASGNDSWPAVALNLQDNYTPSMLCRVVGVSKTEAELAILDHTWLYGNRGSLDYVNFLRVVTDQLGAV